MNTFASYTPTNKGVLVGLDNSWPRCPDPAALCEDLAKWGVTGLMIDLACDGMDTVLDAAHLAQYQRILAACRARKMVLRVVITGFRCQTIGQYTDDWLRGVMAKLVACGTDGVVLVAFNESPWSGMDSNMARQWTRWEEIVAEWWPAGAWRASSSDYYIPAGAAYESHDGRGGAYVVPDSDLLNSLTDGDDWQTNRLYDVNKVVPWAKAILASGRGVGLWGNLYAYVRQDAVWQAVGALSGVKPVVVQDQEANVNRRPHFKWTGEISNYQLYVQWSGNLDPRTPYFTKPCITKAPEYIPDWDFADGYYVWWVREWNSSTLAWGPFSVGRCLVVGNVSAGAPTQLGPDEGVLV